MSALQLGKPPGNTPLQFEETILGNTVKVLLNGGSTLNLVNPDLTQKLRLATSHLPQAIEISLPDGSQMINKTWCLRFELEVEGPKLQS